MGKETTKKATKKAKQLTKTKPVQSPKPITNDDDSEGGSNSGTQVNEATGKQPKLPKGASATPGVASRSVDGDHEEVGTSPTQSNTSESPNSQQSGAESDESWFGKQSTWMKVLIIGMPIVILILTISLILACCCKSQAVPEQPGCPPQQPGYQPQAPVPQQFQAAPVCPPVHRPREPVALPAKPSPSPGYGSVFAQNANPQGQNPAPGPGYSQAFPQSRKQVEGEPRFIQPDPSVQSPTPFNPGSPGQTSVEEKAQPISVSDSNPLIPKTFNQKLKDLKSVRQLSLSVEKRA